MRGGTRRPGLGWLTSAKPPPRYGETSRPETGGKQSPLGARRSTPSPGLPNGNASGRHPRPPHALACHARQRGCRLPLAIVDGTCTTQCPETGNVTIDRNPVRSARRCPRRHGNRCADRGTTASTASRRVASFPGARARVAAGPLQHLHRVQPEHHRHEQGRYRTACETAGHDVLQRHAGRQASRRERSPAGALRRCASSRPASSGFTPPRDLADERRARRGGATSST